MASATYPSTVTRLGRQRLSDLRGGRNWVYLIPALIFFVGYQVYPLLQVAYISFTDYHFLRHDPVQFTGFLNYANAFSDPLVLEGLKRAAIFTAIFLPGVIFIPLFVAIEDTGYRSLDEAIERAELIIDALLGTGRSRPVEGVLAEVADFLAPDRACVEIPVRVDEAGR